MNQWTQKSNTRPEAIHENQEIFSTCENASFRVCFDDTSENITEIESTDEDVHGKYASESVEDVRNFVCNSSDNIRNDNVTHYESYFELAARRRSQIWKPQGQVINQKYTKLFLKGDFLNATTQKLQDQRCNMGGVDNKFHSHAHRKKT